ncbi:MAG: hypothetical protein QG566_421 [Patescibacteria group bacterium]|nr:hypothetical protein [Patescibacteria group bacterium]
MSSKNDFSKKILKILAEKTAISLPELKTRQDLVENKYAVTRSLKGLEEAGMIEHLPTSQGGFTRLTKEGKKKAHSIKLDNDTTLLNTTWDGSWRIIMLDLPEERKAERESLRYLLKKAGFVCLKNSAWISPYTFELMFYNIKKDLNLSTELVILVTNSVDEITEKELYKTFGFEK